MKKYSYILISLFLAFSLAACSTPEEKAASYIENGNELLEEGRLNKALVEFKNALQVNQNLPEAWYGLAKVHERKQEWRKAFATLTRIRDTNPNFVKGRIMLGQLLLASNQIDQALSDANEIMELAPDNAGANALMAAVQFRLGNHDNARASLTRALEIDPENQEAILVKARVLMAEGDYDEALVVLDDTIEKEPQNLSMYLMKLQIYQETENMAATESLYNTLIEVFPENLAFQHALARHHLQNGDIDSADTIMEKIAADNPDDVEQINRLVAFKFQHRSQDEAIELLKRLIADDESRYRLRFNLGELYERSQRTDQAVEIYNAIVEDDGVQPNGLEARNKLAMLKLRGGNIDEARSLIIEVLANDASNENALLVQAGFKINDRQYDDAIVDLRTVLRDNPNSVKAHGLLGQAYRSTGSNELAIESYSKAFSENPALPSVASQLASLLLQEGKTEQAEETLEESIRRGNQSTGAIKLLIQAKLALNDWDGAERLAQAMMKVDGEEAFSEQVMGVVFQGKELKSESIEAFKRAHELSPEARQPVVALVQSYIRYEQIDEAKRFLDSLIKENKNSLTAYYLMSQINLLQGDAEAAEANLVKTIDISPDTEVGYLNLSSLYLRQDRVSDAEKLLMKGMEMVPASTALPMNLARVYQNQQDFDKAIGVYEGLLEKNPDLIVTRNNLASMLTDYRSDQASFDRARQLTMEFKDSDVPQFQDTYAWASVKAGINLEEAVVILKGIVADNEAGVYHYHLGEAYRTKGDPENARPHLEKAIELEADDSPIKTWASESLQALSQ